MAYSKTQSFSLVLVLLTLSQFFHQHPHLVKADTKLIENLCHATEVPDTCIQCLQSDPYAEFATDIELAIIMMTCIRNHADTLQVNMEDTANNSKIKSTKSVYNGCVKAYMGAKKDLNTATEHLQNYEFDKAEKYVDQAMIKHLGIAAGPARKITSHKVTLQGFQRNTFGGLKTRLELIYHCLRIRLEDNCKGYGQFLTMFI
ncbi:hypothetical protein G4B88_008804 [Cannabis sativa]|uniref:Pectinesterase inhibitor domain-containing protein n=1 Tax=Cannabis sativa TaxID=3483 RepID=A0A7J6E2K3_CANSA|nr:hypothetical protein G4B88_008804 [Cannabis sativa]